MSTSTPNSDLNQNQEHSDNSGKKLSLQERKDARTKLTQEINEKLEKQCNFLRNLGNKKASEITDADLAQLKKEGYLQEFDAPLARKLLEERIQLLIKTDDVKKEKTTLKNSLKRARHYSTLLKMKKNPLKILKRKTIQAHIDNFGASNNFHAFEIEDTKHSLGRKIHSQHEEERNLAQKIAAIDNQLGPYTQVNGGFYLLAEKGKEVLPENIVLTDYRNLRKKMQNSDVYSSREATPLALRILSLGKTNEEREKILEDYRNLRKKLQNGGDVYSFGEATNLVLGLLSLGKTNEEREKILEEYRNLRKKLQNGSDVYSSGEKTFLALRILSSGKTDEEHNKMLEGYRSVRKRLQNNDIYDSREATPLALRILSLGKTNEEREKILEDYRNLRKKLQNGDVYNSGEATNLAISMVERIKRGSFSTHDLNETMNQLSSSYKSYLSENNLAEDAMTFNMFIDLLVDGKLDMPFMRGGDMTTGIMMDLMMNFDHDHSFLDSVFDHQGLDSVLGDSMHDISDTLGTDSLTHDLDSLHTDSLDISNNDYDVGSNFDSTDYSSSGSEY